MTGGEEIIAVYECLLEIMKQMLDAARAGEWERVVALERQCKHMVASLAGKEQREILQPALQQRKAAIIGKVLRLDAEIRNIAQPWLQHLQNVLGTAVRKQRLHHAYAQGSERVAQGPP